MPLRFRNDGSRWLIFRLPVLIASDVSLIVRDASSTLAFACAFWSASVSRARAIDCRAYDWILPNSILSSLVSFT